MSSRHEDLGNARNRAVDEPSDAGKLGYQRTVSHNNPKGERTPKWAFVRALCEANFVPWKSRLGTALLRRARATVSRRKPPRRFGRIADTTADPESSKSGNGDLQPLREMTLSSA